MKLEQKIERIQKSEVEGRFTVINYINVYLNCDNRKKAHALADKFITENYLW